MIDRLKLLAVVAAFALYLGIAWSAVVIALVFVGGWDAVIVFVLVAFGTLLAIASLGGRR